MSKELAQLTDLRLQIEQAFDDDDIDTANRLADQRMALLQAIVTSAPESVRHAFMNQIGHELAWTEQIIERYRARSLEIRDELKQLSSNKSAVDAYKAAS